MTSSEHARFRPTTLPRLTPLPASPDVVVIGAGAAGIAAARTLIARGLAVAVLEARPRVGGRAVTAALRGRAIDLGAHWLHAGPINPLVALGHARHEPMRRAAQESHLVVGRRTGTPAEQAAFGRAFDIADRAIARAAAAPGADRPAAAGMPPALGPWRERIALVHGLVSGRPLTHVSLQDWPSMEYDENFFMDGGYGAYLARLAHGLPIALGSPVTRIARTAAGVSVETAGGATVRARAALITLPMMVLRESVRFDPPLPDATRRAIDGFLPGIYEHAVLHWPTAPFRGRDRLASIVGGRHRPPGLFTRIEGSPFHYVELDSVCTHAIDARRGGPDAARRLVRTMLAEPFGHGALHDLAIPAVTEWRHDPWSRGSWAVVPPGHADARTTLQVDVEDRLWFAGEALSQAQWGTVGGAWAEGERAAGAIAARLDARFERISPAAA